MKIYQSEREAGLADLIKSSNTIACVATPQIVEASKLDETSLQLMASIASNAPYRAKATNEGQIDLHYLDTVLVTTQFNNNDDYFDPEEVWLARATPEDKPINFEHNQDDIVGHITGNRVVADDGTIIANDTKFEDLPEKFHIVDSCVLYKYWANAELQKRMDTVIKEIGEKKWFVSMEALFTNFDYAIASDDGSLQIIQRNKKTAFLTKALKIFKGPGKYDGKRIGRVLRNITFSGKGLVKKPANPESIILVPDELESVDENENLEKISSAAGVLGYVIENNIQENKMSQENDTIVKELADAKATIKTLQDSLAKVEIAKATALEDANKAKDSQIAELNKKVDELSKLSETVAKLTEEKNVALASKVEMEAKIKLQERAKQAKAKLKLEDEGADNLVATLASLDDANFEKYLTAQAEYEAAKEASYKSGANEMDKGGNKVDGTPGKGVPVGSNPGTAVKPVKVEKVSGWKPSKFEVNLAPGTSPQNVPPGTVVASEKPETVVNATATTLETVEPVVEPTMSADLTDKNGKINKLRQSVASYFGYKVEENE